MLLAYIDESEYKTSHYYMGALIVNSDQLQAIEAGFDRITTWVSQQVAGFDPDTELHGYPVFQGTQEWEDVPPALRARACVSALRVVADSGASYVSRCINVDRLQARYGAKAHPAHELAFGYSLESIQRVNELDFGGEERVLVIADNHHTADDSRTRIKSLKNDAVSGWNSKKLDCIVDTIYFGPSRYSRLLQASDMATFFFNRRKHYKEKHPQAVKSMRKISRSLTSITRFHHEWPL